MGCMSIVHEPFAHKPIIALEKKTLYAEVVIDSIAYSKVIPVYCDFLNVLVII